MKGKSMNYWVNLHLQLGRKSMYSSGATKIYALDQKLQGLVT